MTGRALNCSDGTKAVESLPFKTQLSSVSAGRVPAVAAVLSVVAWLRSHRPLLLAVPSSFCGDEQGMFTDLRAYAHIPLDKERERFRPGDGEQHHRVGVPMWSPLSRRNALPLRRRFVSMSFSLSAPPGGL